MKKNKIKKVLLLGSGALKIGQAGEFDYSGSQAIKALKEEGIKIILVNPNIATIQTSAGFADRVYFLPIEPYFIEEIIKKEKPGGLLLSFGGQTALNCGLALAKSGVLKRYKIRVLGTPIESIEKTEDRQAFAQTLRQINLAIPQSQAAKTIKKALNIAHIIGYPVMVRAGFALGGQDSGVAKNKNQLTEIAQKALAKSPQILIEEYLTDWKEVEYEVVRDQFDNCITVCNMENVDPMGIHTGESIVVAPSQTLNNLEYHQLREIAIKVIRHLGIVGECNIQFALNPNPNAQDRRATTQKHDGASSQINNETLEYRIIEVNARLSRSSALASKATGYPLAYVAAKLALGYSLTELKNSVTKKTIACFEPALDYVVVKIPRWDLNKFVRSQDQIGSAMQSVGEVMAIGRKFEESLQKAIRMLDIGFEGILDEKVPEIDFKKPTPWRIFAVAKALRAGIDVNKIYATTGIDPFFLYKIKNIVDFEKRLYKHSKLKVETLRVDKQLGFSDRRLAKITGQEEESIRRLRHNLNILPSVKQIDTLAAEYPAQTNYLYLTYNGESDDIDNQSSVLGSRLSDKSRSVSQLTGQLKTVKLKSENRFSSENETQQKTDNRKILVLGSGPYRIGSSVEFDWCSVTCAQTIAANGADPVIVNCNPETVSTDYDMAQRLYFEELTAETVCEIYQKEKPQGVIISMGGQIPNNLALKLAKIGIKILGTPVTAIDQAEDRSKFANLCDQLGIAQPTWAKLRTIREAVDFAQKIDYPVLVRPSYVLSGAAMNVAYTRKDLADYLKLASAISPEHPVVISQFHQNAKEMEIDAVASNGQILTFAITEHIENAGVHSGDSTIVLPPQKLYAATERVVEAIAAKLAKALQITGPFNIQFLAQDNKVMVIECNLRASRSFPFVSKVTGVNFAKLATEAMLNQLSVLGYRLSDKSRSVSQLTGQQKTDELNSENRQLRTDNRYVAVKAPQFSFSRIKGADPILRVEMASTGEVACFGDDIYEAFLKSQIATGIALPQKSVFISLAGDENKIKFQDSAQTLAHLDLKIFATVGTCKFLAIHGIGATKLFKIHEHKKPNVLDFLNAKKIDLVINIFDPYFKKEFDDDYLIRRASIDFGIPLLTNLQTAELFVAALATKKLVDLKVLPWDYYINQK